MQTRYAVYNAATSEFLNKEGEWTSDAFEAEVHDERIEAKIIASKRMQAGDDLACIVLMQLHSIIVA